MRRAGHVAHKGEKTLTQDTWFWWENWKETTRKARRRWKADVEMDFDRDQWLALVYTVMNLSVS
jgi:hypothetical protein